MHSGGFRFTCFRCWQGTVAYRKLRSPRPPARTCEKLSLLGCPVPGPILPFVTEESYPPRAFFFHICVPGSSWNSVYGAAAVHLVSIGLWVLPPCLRKHSGVWLEFSDNCIWLQLPKPTFVLFPSLKTWSSETAFSIYRLLSFLPSFHPSFRPSSLPPSLSPSTLLPSLPSFMWVF